MPSKQILLAAALAAVAPTATVLAQGGTTFNNINDIANTNANANENNVGVSVNVGGGVVAARPTTLSTRTLTPNSTTTSMTLTTTVVTAWSTYCPEPTVLWFERERYVVTKPTMVTYKNCPCTITTVRFPLFLLPLTRYLGT